MSALPRAAMAVLPLLLAALAACDSPSPPSAPPSATTSTIPRPQAPPRVIEPRWPFAGGADAAAAPATFDPGASISRNYYVVFDASGSMAGKECAGGGTKIEVAKRALAGFASRLPADVNLGLSVFDKQGIRELIPLGPMQPDAASQAIASIRAGGNTPLADSIRRAYAALTEQGRRQFGYGEFHLVVITDGEATGENPQAVVNTLLARSPIVLHTIGFCIGSDHSLNQPGRVVYRAADNPAALAAGLAEVLAEAPSFDVTSFK